MFGGDPLFSDKVGCVCGSIPVRGSKGRPMSSSFCSVLTETLSMKTACLHWKTIVVMMMMLLHWQSGLMLIQVMRSLLATPVRLQDDVDVDVVLEFLAPLWV